MLFGTGIRLFDRVDPDRLALNQVRTAASTLVTHLAAAAGVADAAGSPVRAPFECELAGTG